MRISVKHLLLGMSIGVVVVVLYAHCKLTQDNIGQQNQIQTASDTINSDIINTQNIFIPKIGTITKSSSRTTVQFIELMEKSPETIRVSHSLTPSPTMQIVKSTENTLQKSFPKKQEEIKSAPEEIVRLIEKYAIEYGVDKYMMIGIAKCESGFRENAVNGPYAGIYQFVSGTWTSNRRAMGLDENLELRYNAEESVKTAAFKMSRDGFGAWPVCQHKAKNTLISTSEGI